MATNGLCFVEWKEQFVSRERGKRVVHYFLKEISGELVLSVVGTERSVRHMLYVVAEEFLKVDEGKSSITAGYRWRSRREVVNWLTSMLSKQYRQELPLSDPMPGAVAAYQGRLAGNSNIHTSDIEWSGAAWTCGKQLKHFPAFCRNGITIAAQSFVYVMAEEENRHLAYLEDMYEDRKGQKKVRVRWFHHHREVQGVIMLRNPHPKEVFITPYGQVISVECVDGHAVVLNREHYDKCAAIVPKDLFARLHLCFRQFRSNRVKPFKITKLRGYFEQPIFSCLDVDFLRDEGVIPVDELKTLGAKRDRSYGGHQTMPYESVFKKMKYDMLRGLLKDKGVECQTSPFKVNEKIELLCQDSGIRGCWFRCTVLQVSRRKMKLQYDDLKDEDGNNLEEWIPAFRIANPDKLGVRYADRPTIRPAPAHNEVDVSFEVGAPVDAWWSDGWWEGVVSGISKSDGGDLQVFLPSESLTLKLQRKNLRVSRDWSGYHWVDLEANPDVLSAVPSIGSPDNLSTKVKLDVVPVSCPDNPGSPKLNVLEDKSDSAGIAPPVSLPEDIDSIEEDKPRSPEVKNKEDSGLHEKDTIVSDPDNEVPETVEEYEDRGNCVVPEDKGSDALDVKLEAVQKCGASPVEVVVVV